MKVTSLIGAAITVLVASTATTSAHSLPGRAAKDTTNNCQLMCPTYLGWAGKSCGAGKLPRLYVHCAKARGTSLPVCSEATCCAPVTTTQREKCRKMCTAYPVQKGASKRKQCMRGCSSKNVSTYTRNCKDICDQMEMNARQEGRRIPTSFVRSCNKKCETSWKSPEKDAPAQSDISDCIDTWFAATFSD